MPMPHDLTTHQEPASSLVPWSKNPRINDAAAKRLARSIEAHGWTVPILAQRGSRRVIAGHTRLKAAAILGLDSVPVIWLDVDDAQADRLALADNRLGELAEWDNDALVAMLRAMDEAGDDLSLIGWDDLSDFDALVAPAMPTDEAPPVPVEPDSERGAVYELGPHRLVCGDSLTAEAWGALLLDGERLDAVWTDPPYGVAYRGGALAEGTAKERKAIDNDSMAAPALRQFLTDAFAMARAHSCPGAAWYVAAPSGPLHAEFQAALGDVWRHTLTWVKDTFVLGRSDYHYRHEPIFYGWVPGAAHVWTGGRAQDSVIEVPRPRVSKDHPTMKPIELVRRLLANHVGPGAVVGEPFGGSGTTLMACAALGATARLIELDPAYCDVIRRRWTAYADEHGLEAGAGALRDADPR